MKTFILLGFIALSFLSFSQSPFDGEIRWGEPSVTKSIMGEPLGKAGNIVYYANWNGVNHFIDEYDSQSLARLSSTKLELKYNDNKLEFLTTFVSSDQLYFITRFKNKSKHTTYFFVHTYQGQGMLSEPKPIGNIDSEGVSKWAMSKKAISKLIRYYMGFQIAQSDNGEHFVFMYPEKIDVAESSSWTVKLFNKQLIEQSSYQIELKYSDLLISKIKVSNDGIVYGLGLTAIDPDTRYDDYTGFETQVSEFTGPKRINISGDSTYFLKINTMSQTHLINSINTGNGKEISGISMDLVSDGIMVYGLYSTPLLECATGSFFQKFNYSGELVFENVNDFGNGIVTKGTKYESYKGVSRMKKHGIKHYILNDLTETSNGDFIMTAEHYLFYQSPSNIYSAGAGAGQVYQNNYFFGDIMVISCDNAGKTKWVDIIPKSQHSVDDFGRTSSFFSLTSGNKFYVVFNDSELNTNTEELENASLTDKRKAKKNQVVAAVSFDPTGNQAKVILEDNDENKKDIRIIIPRACEKLNNEEFILFAVRGNEQVAGLAKLKK